MDLSRLIRPFRKGPSLEKIWSEVERGEALLIDVRSQEEWEAGHVTFAHHFPTSALQKGHLPDHLPKDKILYLHCQSGGRVRRVLPLMKRAFPRVVPLRYNVADFRSAGWPVR
ncbi:MAG: rhodanese-like domain-containing protein [Parachlamydiales bacterium]